MMGYGGWGFMPMGGMLGMVLLWVVLLALVVWAVSRLLPGRRPGGGSSEPMETPEQILDRRFARGEIDLETYQAQRTALTNARTNGMR